MGCSSSKAAEEPTTEAPAEAAKETPSAQPASAEPAAAAGTNQPPSPPKQVQSASTLDADEVRRDRMSIKYQAKELKGEGAEKSARRSSAPFDKARIGSHTRHGVMPGPRGTANAKINQDRGVVCWPFHGTLNEALLCVFDGHGPKGEKASEFCMTELPAMLEQDHAALKKDPEEALTRNIIQLDKNFLTGVNKNIAMSCGTTSNVLFLRGNDMWVACSGDSRAIKASRVNGKLVATDLSNDHKPDLPIEQARIEKAGGTVTPSGPGGRPSRVWANGRVGLAMSRSIGDGECKGVGVIPDPEVQKFRLTYPTTEGGDGDIFIIVASDGVWEFISSQEAAELIAKTEHAADACEQLVKEAAERWRKEEGNYRDDITAIVTHLPFLEADGADEGAASADDVHFDIDADYINFHAPGISKMADGEASPEPIRKGDKAAASATKSSDDEPEEGFMRRRLSVTNPYGDGDAEWEQIGDDVEV